VDGEAAYNTQPSFVPSFHLDTVALSKGKRRKMNIEKKVLEAVNFIKKLFLIKL